MHAVCVCNVHAKEHMTGEKWAAIITTAMATATALTTNTKLQLNKTGIIDRHAVCVCVLALILSGKFCVCAWTQTSYGNVIGYTFNRVKKVAHKRHGKWSIFYFSKWAKKWCCFNFRFLDVRACLPICHMVLNT